MTTVRSLSPRALCPSGQAARVPGRRTRRRVAGLGAAVITVGAVAACSAQTAPAQTVRDAGAALTASDTLTMRVGLDLDDETTSSVLGAVGGLGSEADRATVERLLDARLETTVTTTDGTALQDVDPDSAKNVSTAMRLLVDDEAVLEVRDVSEVVYVRADVPALEDILAEPGLANDLQAAATQLQGDARQSLDALAAGRWVGVDSSALDGLKELEGLDGLERPGAGARPQEGAAEGEKARAAMEQLLSDARSVLSREVTVEATGPDSYLVTAPLDRIVAGLAPSLRTAAPAITGDGITQGEVDGGLDELTTELADQTVVADITVADGRLASVRADLAQLLDPQERAEMEQVGITGLPVLVELSEEGTVTAPQDAATVGVDELVVPMLALADSMTGTVAGHGAASGSAQPGVAPGAQGDDAGDPSADDGTDPMSGLSPEELGLTQEEFDLLFGDSAAPTS